MILIYLVYNAIFNKSAHTSAAISAVIIKKNETTRMHCITPNRMPSAFYVSRGTHCIVMSMSICLPVHLHISKTTHPNFSNFLCMLPAEVAQSGGTDLVDDVMFSYYIVDPMVLVHHAYSLAATAKWLKL